MAYTPSKHTTSNKPYGVQGLPDGARAYLYEDVTYFKYRPFISIAEVLAYYDTAPKRMGHFSVIINTGGTLQNGSVVGGINDEYWFKDGTTDGNLVIKQANVDLSNYYIRDEINNLLDQRVLKVAGMGLSSYDFTYAEKFKLSNQSGVNTGDQDLSSFPTFSYVDGLINLRIDSELLQGNQIADNSNRITANDASLLNILNNLIPARALDSNVVHKTLDETIDNIKTFTSSPIVPVPTLNGQAMNLQKGRALPQDGVFSRNIGIVAKDQQINVTAGYSRDFLQVTPANNYAHIRLYITDGNSQVRVYEFQTGYDSLNNSWKQLNPYMKYQDRTGDFEIDVRAVSGFGPTNFGLILRIRGNTNASINYRLEYHQQTPAIGGDYEDYTKLSTPEYLTTSQPSTGLYPFQNDQTTKTYVDGQNSILTSNLAFKADKVDVGDKLNLTTTIKTNIVAALNEVDARSKTVINTFQVVNIVDSSNNLKGQLTTDPSGNLVIKSPSGAVMLKLFQDTGPEDALIDPGAGPGFPYTFPFTLS